MKNALRIALSALLMSAYSAPARPITASVPSGHLDAVRRIVSAAMKTYHLKALIVQVRSDGQNVYTQALGESMSGVPATTQMHFRNGAMAFTYMSTLLVELVDRRKASLSDRLDRYFPQLPHAHEITLKNLANMTSGYADYVYQPEIETATSLYPFRHWTSEQLIRIGVSKPMMFSPGTNWGYSHTNYVVLGRVIEKIAGMPLSRAMNQYIIKPMGLRQTMGFETPEIPSPVLHSFSSERRVPLGVPSSKPFYEDSTFWDPSWTTANGAVQTTDITDMSKSMEEVGNGTLLSRQSFAQQVGPNLVRFGHAQRGCNVCHANTRTMNYGLGVVNLGPWMTQLKAFAGCNAATGYLRSQKLTISVVTTFLPSAYDNQGNAKDPSAPIFAALANTFAPRTISLP